MYVTWFDTGMLYYVILVYLVNVTFCNFQISRRSVPRTSRRCRERNPEDRCWHPPEDIAGDTARGGIAGAQDKVREEQILEQRRMLSPSVARVTAFATLGNSAREA
ncbi:unnamed protein product, partial [Staurois parvus]